MKKFFLTLLSLIIVILLFFCNFNIFKIKEIPNNIGNLVNGEALTPPLKPTEPVEALRVECLNDNELLFSFRSTSEDIKSKIRESFNTNGSIAIPEPETSLGRHTLRLEFSLNNAKQYKSISYNIYPLDTNKLLSYEKTNDKLVLPLASLIDIRDSILASYITNGTAVIVDGLFNTPGKHEAKIKFNLNDMQAFDTISYTIMDISNLYANKISSAPIVIEYGATKEMVAAMIRASYESNGIIKLSSLSLEVGSHTASLSFLNPAKNESIDLEVGYEIIPNKDGIVLSNPKIKANKDELLVTYDMKNLTGSSIIGLINPRAQLIAFDIDSYIIVADEKQNDIIISTLPNEYTTTITLKFSKSCFDLDYFLNQYTEVSPFLYYTLGR